jgi:hypothetical protein
MGIAVVVALVARASGGGAAQCEPKDPTAAQELIAATCPCATAASHGAYVTCAVSTAHAAVADARCVREVIRCAARSTCGRPGAAICCRTRADGATRASLVTDTLRCRAPRGGAACISSDPLPCSACVAGGCVTTTTTTTTSTTSTTLFTGVCGNGVIEPPREQCDGHPICSADCLVHADLTCGFGRGYCLTAFPALGFETLQDTKACFFGGGQLEVGRCVPVDPSNCPSPAPDGVFCGTSVDEALPSTSLCCQHDDGTCADGTVASDSQVASFPCDFLLGTDLFLIVGTCGGDGHCVPAS